MCLGKSKKSDPSKPLRSDDGPTGPSYNNENDRLHAEHVASRDSKPAPVVRTTGARGRRGSGARSLINF